MDTAQITAMTAREGLRTQLGALQTEFYAVQAENRKLFEADPQRAKTQYLEQKLQALEEENVRLVQHVSATEERDSQAKSIEETVETLRTENARLRDEVTLLQQSRTDARKRISELVEALELAEARREHAEASDEYLKRRESKRTTEQSSTACALLQRTLESGRSARLVSCRGLRS